MHNLWYNGKNVPLDGYSFVSCRFDNCNLHVASPNFEIRYCLIDRSSTVYYHGESVKILKLFNALRDTSYGEAQYLLPEWHENGTISIFGQ